MLWTVLTVAVFVLAFVIVLGMPRIWPGKKTFGDTEEQGFRLWTGFWQKEDADRLR